MKLMGQGVTQAARVLFSASRGDVNPKMGDSNSEEVVVGAHCGSRETLKTT